MFSTVVESVLRKRRLRVMDEDTYTEVKTEVKFG